MPVVALNFSAEDVICVTWLLLFRCAWACFTLESCLNRVSCLLNTCTDVGQVPRRLLVEVSCGSLLTYRA